MVQSKKITVIPPSLTQFSSKPLSETAKRRVAAYARVSTDETEQLNSYAAQVEYYTSYIQSHSDWKFVNVYADEGISGTSTLHRDGFNKMIEDALDGKIDLILTKSVSRFARNTVDSLTTIRKLKDKGVEVFFEKENIWTLDSKGELLLTIMSSLAQEESRSISENVRWGVHKRFEDGKVTLGYSRFLGYDKGENGNLVINPAQAEIVKRIFDLYLEDNGLKAIAKQLMKEGAVKPSGCRNWTQVDIRRILMNEKYAGNAILQKSYKPDLLSKRRPNNGEVKKFYVEGSHEAIISQERFDLVQAELKHRSKEGTYYATSNHSFSGKVFCSECGSMYGSKIIHSTDKYRHHAWVCNGKTVEEKTCSTSLVKNAELEKAFMSALKKLAINKALVIKTAKKLCATVLDTSKLESQLEKLKAEINETAVLLNQGIGGPAVKDSKRYDELYSRYTQCTEKAKALQEEIDDKNWRSRLSRKFISDIEKLDGFLKEFDKRVFRTLCDRITVYPGRRVVITFKSGYEVEEWLSRGVQASN